MKTNPQLIRANESVDVFRAMNECASKPTSICETKLTTVVEDDNELVKSKITYGKSTLGRNNKQDDGSRKVGSKEFGKVF